MPIDSIPYRLLELGRRRPDAPAYYTKSGGIWRGTSWGVHVREVRRATRALCALGAGSGKRVCLIGFNRPEWVTFDLASMCAGGAPAGIYTTCSPDEVQYVAHHAEAPVVLVENAAQWEKIRARRAELPHLKHVVMMRGPKVDDPMVLSWEQFLARGDAVEEHRVDDLVAALEPQGLATLIYTSGTTGPPKGVMLSHENLAWTSALLQRLVGGAADDVFLSYLPLSHIAEQMATIHGPITSGAAVYYAESLDKIGDNLREVRPQVFFGVPRVWEKMHATIMTKLAGATGMKKRLVQWARRVGTASSALSMRGRPLSGALAVQVRLAERLVFSKLAAATGLDRARVLISGAAPIGRDVLEDFASLGLVVHEIYGQSEGSGPTGFNLPGATKLGSVGRVLPGVEVKIAGDGEILVRGPNVFLGYAKEPEATREVLVDGWLYSGDLGAIDSEGYLAITGRKKEIIITAGGKNITPRNIEEAIERSELVREAVVVGDRRKYLTALITLDRDAAERFARDRGLSTDALHELPEIAAAVQTAIDLANQSLARVEQVKKFRVLPRNFGIDSGELTPTLKLKRKVVAHNFAPEIESMYTEG